MELEINLKTPDGRSERSLWLRIWPSNQSFRFYRLKNFRLWTWKYGECKRLERFLKNRGIYPMW